MTQRLTALVAATGLLLLSPVSVLAHAELVESNPADGYTIETPYTLTATFSEELLERSNIIVVNSADEEVARGVPDPNDPTVMVVDLPNLPAGDYVAAWTARTADGHTERAEIQFSVASSATPPGATPGPTGIVDPSSAPVPTPTLSQAASAFPIPSASVPPTDGQPTTGASDVLLALLLAGVVIGAIGLFLFARSRR